MSRYRGHYLPVAARREALRVYRDRRTNGMWRYPNGPADAIGAMRATVRYFEGWLAHAAALGDPLNHIREMRDGYLAAHFYLDLMYRKPAAFRYRAPRAADVRRAREWEAELAQLDGAR